MTRKDYVLVARIIRDMSDEDGAQDREALARKFADALAAQNANFNAAKFMTAATGKKCAA